MRKPEQDILYKMHLLEDLIERQSKLINTANQIIDMKTKLIDLCEEEVAIYKKENITLKLMCVAAFALLITISTILIITK